mgnify:FL=1
MAVPYPAEMRAQIIERAKDQIIAGDTLADIAAEHGISRRTLLYWLAQLGEEYERLRQAWIDHLLVDAGEQLEGASEALPLARARELWKRATWYAERRDAARYGQRTEAALSVGVTVIVQRADAPQQIAPEVGYAQVVESDST